jgi:tRNA(Ile)-lysidine synthetase-like protein
MHCRAVHTTGIAQSTCRAARLAVQFNSHWRKALATPPHLLAASLASDTIGAARARCTRTVTEPTGHNNNPLASNSGNEPTEIQDNEFARMMVNCWPTRRGEHVAVAVSGGPDSVALAVLLAKFCQRFGYCLHAITVDHQFRAESAAEAAAVGEIMRKHGVEHHIETLHWEAKPHASELQSRARTARYDAIATTCGKLGIKRIYLAHQLNDQIETVLSRFARSSGISGLVPMAPEKLLLAGTTVCRPLLSVKKARLVATCHATGLQFCVDKSNFNVDFDRVRCRVAAQRMHESTTSPISFDDFSRLLTNASITTHDINVEGTPNCIRS